MSQGDASAYPYKSLSIYVDESDFYITWGDQGNTASITPWLTHHLEAQTVTEGNTNLPVAHNDILVYWWHINDPWYLFWLLSFADKELWFLDSGYLLL